MVLLQYTAKVKNSLLLELPTEAEELHLKPGDEVEVRLTPRNGVQKPEKGAAIAGTPLRVSALGKYAGTLNTEEFMRRKQEDIDREDRPRR